MTREEKIAKAQRLRDKGLKLREIAEVMGLSGPRTAWRLVNPERDREQNRARNDKKRAWEAAQPRGVCQDCGAETGLAAFRGTKRCFVCHVFSEAERVEVRAHKIEEWWSEGLTLLEIADKLGWSKGHVSMEMHRLREQGYELPYRHQHHKNLPRFPEQAAA